MRGHLGRSWKKTAVLCVSAVKCPCNEYSIKINDTQCNSAHPFHSAVHSEIRYNTTSKHITHALGHKFLALQVVRL